MPAPLLLTKLYVPPPRPKIVLRSRLIERLNEGLHCKLTLISAPAGFGKTTLVSEWLSACGRPAVWLSLDEEDGDPTRFLMYLVAALQTAAPKIGAGVLAALQSPQPPPAESILTALLNEIADISGNFILVLDDYHVVDSQPVDKALAFLVEHQPPQMHLVIGSREDPSLPLARLRARGQLTELRAADLRFTPAEAAEFLNQVMGLNLSAEDIAALGTRTEGWIAGLQMAALSMQGQEDINRFIQSFTGSHRFVMDYLVEEVLQQQPASVQAFLLRTSILDRLCGSLCETVLLDPSVPGQENLEYLEHTNLFIVPLDNERHWYRYHHLFGDLLRKRLRQSLSPNEISQLHIRASEWYENIGLVFEAFHHATLANDVVRAERLIESKEMGLHLYSVSMPILDWLTSLPKTVLDSRPGLWVRSATLELMTGQTSDVEEKLQAAEKALQGAEPDEKIRDLIGQIACARATLALFRYDTETMIIQAHRALEYLHPENLAFRFSSNWALASAFMIQGDRAAAARACQDGIAISQKSGNVFSKILATFTLGQLQELNNQLHQAAETYQQMMELSGEHPRPSTVEVHLGLARIHYEWNELDAAEQHGQQSLRLARLYEHEADRFIISEVFLARLKLVRGDVGGAGSMLSQTEQTARQKNFSLRLPEIAAAQVHVLLKQNNLPAAAELARRFELPLSQARVLMAQGDPSTALAVLEPFRQQMEVRGWVDEQLKAMVLQAVALHRKGEKALAVQLLGEALALAEPGGFIRTFLDEGEPMAQLMLEAASKGIKPGYTSKLLAAFDSEKQPGLDGAPPDIVRSGQGDTRPSGLAQASPGKSEDKSFLPPIQPLIEPLSQRELEVLQLIAQGLSNHEICERLFLALDTVKGHNRRIFDKLQVQRRTEAIARARELGLL